MGNLASAVDELAAVDAAGLSDAALAEDIVEIDRQINRLTAVKLGRLERLDRRGTTAAEFGSTAAWHRAAGRLSPLVAGREVHLARDLADRLPATAAALAVGAISAVHAQVIAALRRDVPAEPMAAAEPHIVELARSLDPAQLRRALAHIRHQYAPDRLAQDEADLWAERRLTMSSTLDGLATGHWSADAASQELIATAIHAACPPVSGDDRTASQRRFDGLLTVCELALRSGRLPDTGGVKPHVSVLVAVNTLDGQPGSDAAALAFGEPLSGSGARRIACDAAISRIVLGPRSEVLDAGRAIRGFPAAMRRAIVARDRQCIWPGCDAPPGWCDAHHIQHWALGGRTSIDNGVLVCGRHHDRIHHQNLAIVRLADGRYSVDRRRGSDTQDRGDPDDP